jgi:hypothetical protein
MDLILLADYSLGYTLLMEEYIEFHILLWPKKFLFGVLLYFYVHEMTQPQSVILRESQTERGFCLLRERPLWLGQP